jgi:F-type H+-transporting ATPase subunit a
MEHEYSLLYLLLQPILKLLPKDLYSDHVVMITVVTLFLVIGMPLAASKLKSGNRSKFQQSLEVFFDAIHGMVKERTHLETAKHAMLIASFGVTIFIFNAMGAIPFLTSPTPNMNTTVSLAIVSFLYYNYQGIKHHGPIGYSKTLMGPLPAIAPVMFLAELISHFARVLSLSLRLAASMGADHIVIIAFTSISAFIVPVPMIALGLGMAGLQTYIFTMLSTMYLGGALSEEH